MKTIPSDPPAQPSTRRFAWTRLAALALAALVLVHAAQPSPADAWLSEGAAAVEASAALLLLWHRSRPFGVMLGAAMLALLVLAEVLMGAFAAVPLPLALLAGLLLLGRRIDAERQAHRPHPASET